MGKRNATRVTAADIAKAGEGGVKALVKELVSKAKNGDSETKESAACMLKSLAEQNHNEHTRLLFRSGAIPPLVQIIATGTAKAQGAACSALCAISTNNPEHQRAMMEAEIAGPLVKLTKGGSPKVQEEAASTIAAIGADEAHQKALLKAGCVQPLVALLSKGSEYSALIPLLQRQVLCVDTTASTPSTLR